MTLFSQDPETVVLRNINHNGFEAVTRKTKLINAVPTNAASKPWKGPGNSAVSCING